jgi:AI-2 transport protein TqsA
MDQDEAERHRTYLVSGVWVIATIGLGAAAYVSREILSPFALALLLWLVMEGLAREINRRLPKAVPRFVGHLMAIAIVIVSIVLSINILRDAFTRFAAQYPEYEQRINGTIV